MHAHSLNVPQGWTEFCLSAAAAQDSMMKANDTYNALMSPVSCSPDSCWELILLGHLLAKSLTLGFPTGSLWQALPRLFLSAAWTAASWYLQSTWVWTVWPPPQLPRGISAPKKGVLTVLWDTSTAPILPTPLVWLKSHLFWNAFLLWTTHLPPP